MMTHDGSSRRVVAFDYGGTLNGTPPRERRWAFYALSGFHFSRDRLRAAHRVARDRLLAMPGVASMSLHEGVTHWFRYEMDDLGLSGNGLDRWVDAFCDDELRRLRSNRACLERLATEHVLAVISNNVGNVPRILAEAGLADLFTAIIDSALCGLRKPDARVFRHCERLVGDAGPADCWLVGDNWEKDVQAALAAGWNAIHFCSDAEASHRDRRVPRVLALSDCASVINRVAERVSMTAGHTHDYDQSINVSASTDRSV